jgi:hypothetical protein
LFQTIRTSNGFPPKIFFFPVLVYLADVRSFLTRYSNNGNVIECGNRAVNRLYNITMHLDDLIIVLHYYRNGTKKFISSE